MPYPPPPPPPDVGEFQGIGLLPAPQIPDVTGHAGEFLETDGIIPQWEPVTAILPPQAGHASEFLTTDGVNASWAPAAGGTTTVGTITAPTTNAATIVGSVLHIATADPTNPGILSTGGQNLGGQKVFWDGAAVSVYDVRDFGAAPNSGIDTNLWTNDCTQALYNIIGTWQAANTGPMVSNQGTIGKIYLPTGTWVVSKPICLPSGCEFYGDGRLVSRMYPGLGTATTNPGNVQGFSGPLIYSTGYVPAQLPSGNFPSYGAPLVGATGQSMVLNSTSFTDCTVIILHDSFAWSKFMGGAQANSINGLTLQLWARVDDTPVVNMERVIMGSRGPEVWLPPDVTDIAFGFYVMSNDGVNMFIRAYLTTSNDSPGGWSPSNPFEVPKKGVQHHIDSGNITPHVPINIELDYDGANIYFYINGVHQGNTPANGPVVRAPWEGVTIGRGGPEFEQAAGQSTFAKDCITGFIDSVRLSAGARHTGTGSFSPPAAKYTFDGTTLALINMDQAVPTVQAQDHGGTPVGQVMTLPFFVAQANLGVAGFGETGNPSFGGAAPHYCRLAPGRFTESVYIHDLFFSGFYNASGPCLIASDRANIENCGMQLSPSYGFRVTDSVSFYSQCDNLYAYSCVNYGIQWFGDASRTVTQACGIGVQQTVDGALYLCRDQPVWNNYIGILVGPGGSAGSRSVVTDCSNDAEVWDFTRQISPAVVLGRNMGSVTFNKNFWSALHSPPVTYFGVPGTQFGAGPDERLGSAVHNQDLFTVTATDAPCETLFNYGSTPGNVVLNNCQVTNTSGNLSIPFSNRDNWISVVTPKTVSNQASISVTDVVGRNLTGKFTIQNGFTTGGPLFFEDEPDTNYNVVCFPESYTSSGGPPAAGSNRPIFPIAKRTDGFTVTVEADPGGDVVCTWTYHIIRGFGDPELSIPLPAIPTSVANPFSGETGDFYFGVTAVPTSGNVFVINQSIGNNSVLEAGTTIGNTAYWEMYIQGSGGTIIQALGPIAGSADAFVSIRGQLCSFLSPGTHNMVIGRGGNQTQFFLDGPRGQLPSFASGFVGPQAATLYIGQRFDGSNALTSATLRNLKGDHNPALVFSVESDSGPQSMQRAAFFGDQWIQGQSSSSALGGFASQIAQARYGTAYYYFAAALNAIAIDEPGILGMNARFWRPWGASQTLETVCFMTGFYDILLYSRSAADIMAAITPMIDGAFANALWNPPIAATGDPWAVANGQAWAEFVPPTTGTATCVIDGINIPCTFTTNNQTTATNQANAINANGTLGVYLNAQALNLGASTGNKYNVFLKAKTYGTAGNATTCTTDGGGGAFWFTGPFGGGHLFGGTDTVTTIAGQSFISNFDTNANTTVNNLIAAVAANPTTNALVTGTLVSGRMLCTANTIGSGGNSIVVGSAGPNRVAPPWSATGTGVNIGALQGGLDGAIPNGVTNIILCNIPPMGNTTGWSAGKETIRTTLNGLIAAYCAGSGGAVTLADVDLLLRNPADHTKILPLYGFDFPNNVGHIALFNYLAPLLPGVGTPPSALSYATNPATYASGGPIASNNPTVTGTVVRWTVDPPLPAGLAISSTTGHITGTPTTPTAIANYLVAATNTAGTITVSLSITIT